MSVIEYLDFNTEDEQAKVVDISKSKYRIRSDLYDGVEWLLGLTFKVCYEQNYAVIVVKNYNTYHYAVCSLYKTDDPETPECHVKALIPFANREKGEVIGFDVFFPPDAKSEWAMKVKPCFFPEMCEDY